MAKLIIALDYTDALDALNMSGSLQGTDIWMKVGLELFIREGPKVAQTIKRMGFNVMLDLKLHDIPNTVRGAVRSAAWIGANIITIHISGGESMCKAAMEEAALHENRPLIFGVTVLTNMEQKDLPPGIELHKLVFDLAGKANQWGLDGIVCSGLEVEAIKKAYPHIKCLTPGIRPEGISDDDQRRTVTPAQAVKYGADFLVVGRPVTRAPNPAEAAKNILAKMLSAE
jgi:orotidine-5'-phosphate decarboxylase